VIRSSEIKDIFIFSFLIGILFYSLFLPHFERGHLSLIPDLEALVTIFYYLYICIHICNVYHINILCTLYIYIFAALKIELLLLRNSIFKTSS
jgi:hypothetical protein